MVILVLILLAVIAGLLWWFVFRDSGTDTETTEELLIPFVIGLRALPQTLSLGKDRVRPQS